MADNRCLLTPDGEKARNELLQLLFGDNRVTSTAIEEITGLDRGQTIPKLLGIKEGDIQGKKIEQFFNKLIETLRERWECGGVRNPLAQSYFNVNVCSYWQENKTTSTPKRITTRSIEQQMAEVLMYLDYNTQSSQFGQQLSVQTNIDAIAMQVHGDDKNILQQLLVKRLSQFLIGGETYRVIPIKVDSALRNGGVDEFWSRISPYFENCLSPESNTILDAIYQTCLTQPVIIVLYNFHGMGRSLTSFMNEFWSPLTARFSQQDSNIAGKRILLMMTGDQSLVHSAEILSRYSSIMLPELDQISSADIDAWLDKPEVHQLKNRCVFDKRSLDLNKISTWGDDTYGALDAMELICEAFGFTPNLNQFQEYWKLTGDLVA